MKNTILSWGLLIQLIAYPILTKGQILSENCSTQPSTWTFNSIEQRSGYWLADDNSDYVISPVFGAYTSLELVSNLRSFGGGSFPECTIEISTDGGSTWTGGTFVQSNIPNSYTDYTWNIGTLSGTNNRIRWRRTGGTRGLRINDIELTGTPASCTAPTTQASSITFSGITANQMEVDWTNGNGQGRIVKINTTNSFTNPTTGDDPAANLTYGSGEQVVFNGSGSGPITITGLSASTNYFYRIYEYCTTGRAYNTTTATGNPANQATNAPAGSTDSDIIADAAFDEPDNIAYDQYQGNSLTTSNSIEVARFTIRDGGAGNDADAFSTILTDLSLNITQHGQLNRVAIFDGNVNEAEVAAAASVSFSGLNLEAGDDGIKDFSIRVSFQSSVTDNAQIAFAIISATAQPGNSLFFSANAGGAASSTVGDDNRIEVTATDLVFDQNPSDVNINQVMIPAPTVWVVDNNVNIDLDYSSSISLSTTGSFDASATTSTNPISGIATFSNLIFSSGSSGSTLTATAPGLNQDVSSTFDVLNICGNESFVNIPSNSSTSYLTRTWVGDNGSSFTATDARTDQTINGEAITIRNGELSLVNYAGGISALTLTTQRVFSGGTGNLTISVNGSSVGSIPYDATVQTSTITGINTTGNFDLEIATPSNGDRIKLDDLEWTCFASDRYWDATAGAGNGVGGTATWGTTFSTSATGDAALTTASGTDNAIFQGTAGTITLDADQSANQLTFNVSGYTLATSGSGSRTLTGSIDLGGNSLTLSPSANAELELPGSITGAGSLTHSGVGTTTFSGSNAFSGGLTINQGTVSAAADNHLGSGNLTLDGGILRISNGFSSAKIITLSSTSTLEVATGQTLTLTANDAVTGAGGLTKTGDGTLAIDQSNDYDGKTTISAGWIEVSGESQLGDNPGSLTADQITLDGGGIRNSVGSNITFDSNRGITLGAGGGTFEVTSGQTITAINAITGAGGLTKTGAGTLAFDYNGGTHDYSGSTTLTEGTLRLERNNDIPDASNLVLNGGTLDAARSSDGAGRDETAGTLTLSANSTINLGSGSHELHFANSSAVTWAGNSLNITGWSGTGGSSGTAGRIFVGNDATGLTAAQLAKITFNGYTGTAIILSTGEIVPPPPAPEIHIRQNATDYANGSTYAFGSHEWGSSQAVTFTIDNQGDLTLNITSANVSGTGFSLSASPASTVAAAGSTTFEVTFSPNGTGSFSGSISVDNDDTDENPYVINFTGSGLPNTASDIVRQSVAEPEDINYLTYTNISDINASNSVEVAFFSLRDAAGGTDADILNTELTDLSFTISNHQILDRIALYDNSVELAETTVSGNTVSFSGFSLVANDGGSNNNFSLRVTYQSSVTDNTQNQFTITSATAAATGSGFAAADAGGAATFTTGDRNRIEVTATQLAFGQQPTATTVGSNMTPAPTVRGEDANGNLDLDFGASVSVTSTGGLVSSPQTANAASGIATFSSIEHSGAGNFTLTASSTGLTNATSNAFAISTIATGSYRTTSAGTWPSGTATWEEFDGTSWGSSSAPSSNTTDILYIRHQITTSAAFAAPSPGSNMVVENGGNFIAQHNCTFASLTIENGGTFEAADPAVDINSTSGTVTVESGGTVIINSSTLNNTDGFWGGKEDFQNGSTLEIQDWDWDGPSSQGEGLIDGDNTISTNADGYYFGNIYFNASPNDKAFTLVSEIGTHLLCQNDLRINNGNSATNRSVILTNVNANVEIGGDIIAEQNRFSFGAVGSSALVHTVRGNITGDGGTIDLNQQSAGGATVTVNVEGNVTIPVGSTLQSTDDGCKIVFTNTTTPQNIEINGTLGSNVDFEIAADAEVQLIQDLDLVNNTNDFSVLADGTLHFNGFDLTGSGGFTLEDDGVILITSADGVNASGASGNVQTSSRSFSQTGHYHFVGSASPQSTGTAMTVGSTAKRIIINKDNATDVVNLTQSTGTSELLQIDQGILAETNTANINGSGDLTMNGGTYRSALLSTTWPQLTGTYNLAAGSTLQLNGVGAQTLRGGEAYQNLTFSESGTKDITSATPDIAGTVTIEGSATLDVGSSTFGGANTDFTMTGGRFRASGSRTLPDMDGSYSLSAGTVELYGTATNQGLRGSKNYFNVEITNTSDRVSAGVVQGAGNVGITGTFTIANGACYKMGGTAVIDGSGDFLMQTNATLVFGSGDGITTSGATGNIQVTGSRTFPSDAGYGFRGSVSPQLPGNGLPSTVDHLILQKDNADDQITLAADLTVSSELIMESGQMDMGGNALTLGTSTSSKGTLSYTAGHIIGQMRRYFSGVNSGNASGLFPIANANAENRHVLIEYQTAPTTGGHLTVSHQSTAMGTAGLRDGNGDFQIDVPAVGSCAAFTVKTTAQEYWDITEQSGTLSDGLYTLTLTAENKLGVGNTCGLRLLKREGSGDWEAEGTHIAPSGSISQVSIAAADLQGWSNFGFGGDGDINTLPITLIRFGATATDQGAMLQWEVADADNFARFDLEKSTDGRQFQQIASIAYQPGQSHYHVQDFSFAALSYYRLRLIDLDDTFEYSKVISLSPWQDQRSIRFYPSQGDGRIECDYRGQASVTVFNLQNQILGSASGQSDEVAKKLSALLHHAPQGLYLLQTQFADQLEVFKYLKR